MFSFTFCRIMLIKLCSIVVEGFRKRNYAISSNRAKSVYEFIYSNERSPKHWATLQERESSNLVYVWQMARPPAPSCFYKHWEKALSLRPLCGSWHIPATSTRIKERQTASLISLRSSHETPFYMLDKAMLGHLTQVWNTELLTDIFSSESRQKFAGEDMIQHEERGYVFRSGLNYGSKTRGRECGS